MPDEVMSELRKYFSSTKLRKKKNGWYISDEHGIRGVYFEKDRWRDSHEQKYDPIICCYPMEFLEGDTIPPYYKFPIRDYASEINGIDWGAVESSFDSSIEVKNRSDIITDFLQSSILPFLSNIKTTEQAFSLYEKGILKSRAFLRPVRPRLIERFGNPSR